MTMTMMTLMMTVMMLMTRSRDTSSSGETGVIIDRASAAFINKTELDPEMED